MNNFSLWLDQRFNWIQAIMVMVIIAIGGYAWLWPEYQQMQSTGVLEWRSAEATLSERRTYLTNLEAMQQNYNELDKRLFSIVNSVLPQNQVDTRMFAEVERVFKAGNFQVDSIAIASPTSTADAQNSNNTNPLQGQIVQGGRTTSQFNEQVKTNIITVNASATTSDYAGFKKLLEAIEQQQNTFNIQSINYTADGTAFTFILHTYTFTPEK